MSDMHPIVQHPKLRCGKPGCNQPLVFPMTHGVEVEPGFVLAECNICAIAVKVPVSALAPLPAIQVEKTVARPPKKAPGT
jgi:hypothetical protein